MADNIIYKQSWLDLIFKDKNQVYGAYLLRQLYSRNIFVALISATTVFVLAISGPVAYKHLFPEKEEKTEEKKKTKSKMYEMPPPADAKVVPPPPVVEPPKVELTKFLPPVPKPDEMVTEEIKTIEELKDDNISDRDQEGDKNVAASFGEIEEPKEEQKAVEIEPEEFDISEIQEMPDYPGGQAEKIKLFNKNIKYPPVAEKMGITGKVFVSFSVDADGSLSNFKVIKGLGSGLDEEAIRLAKLMPNWIPGRQNGKPVKVRSVVIPIVFALE